jgi:hypothetical protein
MSTWIGVTIVLVVGSGAHGNSIRQRVASSPVSARHLWRRSSVRWPAGVLIAIWQDARTLNAIQGSGGLGDVFALPWMLIIPGALLGTIDGLLAVQHAA